MDAAKIRLSAKEMELVINADWILTKNRVMEKAKLLLQDLQNQVLAYVLQGDNSSHPESNKISPKISKGENYHGLPYLILDYPRIFEKENILAIRTMFWWGNFFSTTLHVAGSYKAQTITAVAASYDLLKSHEFLYCVNDDEWEHHFEATNYLPVAEMTAAGFEKSIEEKSFLKLAKKISLHQWDNACEMLLNDYKILMKIISCRDDERGL